MAIWTLAVAPGGAWAVPPAAEPGLARTLYFYSDPGEVRVAGRHLRRRTLVRLDPGREALVENVGGSEARLLLLQGRPIGEPVAQHGPFVMNTREELGLAFADYRAGRFGAWPWGREDPVAPRGEGRFARYADGRVERPRGAGAGG